MPMDGITLGAIARELHLCLEGGRVDRVQQPERDELQLTIRAKGQNHRLLLCCNPSNPRAHLTQVPAKSPATPPMLCMLLRKHLSGARLVSVTQEGADRVLLFHFEAVNELGDLCQRQLVLEVMGRHSNIIFIGDNNRIIDSARHVSDSVSRVRELLPGLPYEPAPAQGKLNPYLATEEQYTAALLPLLGQRLDKAILACVSGVSPQLSRELAFRICGQEQTELTEALLPAAASGLLRFFRELQVSPTLLVDEFGSPLDVMPFAYLSRDPSRQIQKSSMSQAVEEYFLLRSVKERIREKSHNLRRFLQNALERCEKKRAIQLQTLKDSQGMDSLRKKGDLVTAQMHAIERGASFAEVPDYFDEQMPLIRIDLNPALSPAENAQRYYKLYNKMKAAADLVLPQMEQNDKEIAYFEGQLDNLDKCEDLDELGEIRLELEREGYIKPNAKSKKQPKLAESKPLAFVSSNGIEIYVGKNNLQNDRLTFSAKAEEIWLHVKDRPGSHVILRSTKPDELSLTQAAKLAAFYSRAKQSENVAVDYTQRRFVKKPSGAKPGFVIYTNQSTLFVTPDEDLTKRLQKDD